MKIWKPLESKLVPGRSTWAMKKKANGTFRARLNARGFEQVDGVTPPISLNLSSMNQQ